MVVCVDEKTNLQPRPRLAATLPARPGQPMRLENEYKRVGALLTQLDREIPPSIGRIGVILDNSSVHTGKQARAWLTTHPRFVCHFLPVHCSWMSQAEQWFSILQRKRLRISDFTDLDHLAEQLIAYVSEWNAQAHPLSWSTKSEALVMAKCEAQAAPFPAA